jgi:hypothetical protein
MMSSPDEHESVGGGDGGPLVVIQESDFDCWNATEDTPILVGGTVRTDYDLICEPEDGVQL